MGRKIVFAVGLFLVAALPLEAQTGSRDSTRADTVVLRPIQVSVTRSPTLLRDVPNAVGVVTSESIQNGRPTLGLDEALVSVPGIAISNRYNPSQDQRISIRGFGARSAFGVRGVKILIDGIPQHFRTVKVNSPISISSPLRPSRSCVAPRPACTATHRAVSSTFAQPSPTHRPPQVGQVQRVARTVLSSGVAVCRLRFRMGLLR